MPLKDYIQRYEDGGDVTRETEDVAETDDSVTTAAPVTAATASKKSPLAQKTEQLTGSPDAQAARDSRLRAYYDKQLADITQRENSFAESSGINEVLAQFGAPPGAEEVWAKQRASELSARNLGRKEAELGLSELDTQKALTAQRKTVSDLLRSGKPEDVAAARAMDPDYVKKVVDVAQSSYGKQASDMGLKPGTPEFAKYVESLRREDFALKKQQADVAVAKLNLAISKDATKPLSGIEQKAVNQMTETFAASSRNVEELKQMEGIVKDSGFFDTGVSRYANPKYWFGAGTAAEIESRLSALAPKQRPPGAGATSDYDAKQYLKAVGGGMSKENLQKTIQVGIAMNKHDADYAMFMATVKENRGSTTEAAKIWQQYANNNPIFDKNGNVIPNRKSIQEWADAGMPKASETPASPGAPAAKPPAAAPAAKPGGTIAIGDVRNGYRFKGGDPNKQENWEKE